MITKHQAQVLSDLWSSWVHGAPSCHTDCGKLYPLVMSEVRDHDKWRPTGTRRGLSFENEARYMALKRIAEFTIDGRTEPSLAHYWAWLKSIYGAYALTIDIVTGPVVKSWASARRDALADLLTWDYSEMVRK